MKRKFFQTYGIWRILVALLLGVAALPLDWYFTKWLYYHVLPRGGFLGLLSALFAVAFLFVLAYIMLMIAKSSWHLLKLPAVRKEEAEEEAKQRAERAERELWRQQSNRAWKLHFRAEEREAAERERRKVLTEDVRTVLDDLGLRPSDLKGSNGD